MTVSRFDWTIVRTAATGGLIIIVPGAFIAGQLFGGQSASRWAWGFFVVVLIGFALSGYIGGRLRPDTPMLHGSAGALAAFVVAQVFGVVVTVAQGGSISWIAIPLTALLALSMGVVGALASDLVHRRAARVA